MEMNNITMNSQNGSKDEQLTKIFIVSSNAFYGCLGTAFNLVLMCYQLQGFGARKAYEYIIFTTTVVDFLFSVNKITFLLFAILQHNEMVCKYCGLLFAVFSGSAVMLSTVNMLHRYLSLHNPVWINMTKRGIAICTIVPILFNVACYSSWLEFDAFGFDALGGCSMKAQNGSSRINWTLISMVEIFSCQIASIMLGYLIIRKLRMHTGQMIMLKSRIVQESRQIVKLTMISTIWPIICALCSFVGRLMPAKSRVLFWFSRILSLFTPMMLAVIPIITVIIIKDYKKSFVRFFKGSANNISPVEQLDLKVKTRGKGVNPENAEAMAVN